MLTEAQFNNLKRIRTELQTYLETIQVVPLEDLQTQLSDAHAGFEAHYYDHDEDWREATGGQKMLGEVEELEAICGVMDNAVDSVNESISTIERTINDITKLLGD